MSIWTDGSFNQESEADSTPISGAASTLPLNNHGLESEAESEFLNQVKITYMNKLRTRRGAKGVWADLRW